MKQFSPFALNIILALLLLTVFAQVGALAARPRGQAPVLVPDFTLPAADGREISLSDFRGKVVVLNFWASWCAPCRFEMDELQKLHDLFSESDQAVLLLLNQIDNQLEDAEAGSGYLNGNNYSMTNLYDYGQIGRGLFGIPGLPTTVVIDARGYLSDYAVGPVTAAAVLKMVEEAK